MSTNEITPKDSACPVFIDPIDEAQIQADAIELAQLAAAKQAILDAKASAEAKLVALGLTADEIAALKA